MSKILIIGVGGCGRRALIKMKDAGISNVSYITFGDYGDEEEAKEHDIPHFNLIEMNNLDGISNTDNPKVFEWLAENSKNKIKEIIEYFLNEDANEL